MVHFSTMQKLDPKREREPDVTDEYLERMIQVAKRDLNISLTVDRQGKWIFIMRQMPGVGPMKYARVDDQLNLYHANGIRALTNLETNPDFMYHLRKHGIESEGTEAAYTNHIAELSNEKKKTGSQQNKLQILERAVLGLAHAVVQTDAATTQEALLMINGISKPSAKLVRFRKYINDLNLLRDVALAELKALP